MCCTLVNGACKGCLLIPQDTRESHLRGERTRHNIKLYRRVSIAIRELKCITPIFFLSVNHDDMVDVDPYRHIHRHIREDEAERIGKQHFDWHLVQYQNDFLLQLSECELLYETDKHEIIIWI